MPEGDNNEKPGIVSKAKDKIKDTATPENMQKILAKMRDLEEQIQESKGSYEVGGPSMLAMGQIDIKRLEALTNTLRTLNATGLTYAPGSKLNKSLEAVAANFDRLTGNASLGAKGIEELAQKYEQFGVMSENLPDGAQLAEQFASQAAAMDRLGLSFSEYTKNMDLAQNMFALTGKEVKSINQGLFDFAKEMKMMPSVVSQNFQLVAKSLSYEAPKVAEQFKKMQKLSQQTGVGIGTFMGGFGDKLDTISGAAAFTGQLNAILGTNAFSPNEILMMDEAERMIKVREVLQGHPIYNEIKSGGKLGKFALNTVSKLTGFSKEDTRKYILGKSGDGSLKSILAKKTGGTPDAKSSKAAVAAAGKSVFGKGEATDLRNALVEMTTMIKNVSLNPLERAWVEDRARYIPASRGGKVLDQRMSAMDAKDFVEFGRDTKIKETLGTDDLKAWRRSRTRFSQISDLTKRLMTMDPDADETQTFRKALARVIQLAGEETMTEKQDSAAYAQLADMLESSSRIAIPSARTDDIVSMAEQVIIDKVPKFAGGKLDEIQRARSGRGDSAAALKALKEEEDAIPESIKNLTPAAKESALKKFNEAKKKKRDETNTTSDGTPKPDLKLGAVDVRAVMVEAMSGLVLELNLGEGTKVAVNHALKQLV